MYTRWADSRLVAYVVSHMLLVDIAINVVFKPHHKLSLDQVLVTPFFESK